MSMHFACFRSTFLSALKFVQIKEWRPNFLEEPILQNVWIIWFPFLYFNLKSFLDINSSWFIRFQCILHDSGVLFSESWISEENQFFRMSELFGPPFCSSILKILFTKNLCHSLDFIAFCMIEDYPSQSLGISRNF